MSKPPKIPYMFRAVPEECFADDVTRAELMVFAYVVKHTIPFGRNTIDLSRNELTGGRFGKDKDGNRIRIDAGCGATLDGGQFKAVRERLIARGWVSISYPLGDRGRKKIRYTVMLDNFTPVESTPVEVTPLTGNIYPPPRENLPPSPVEVTPRTQIEDLKEPSERSGIEPRAPVRAGCVDVGSGFKTKRVKL